jgi:tRNA nucleotidyltransferase (CCA-adding enzyme)
VKNYLSSLSFPEKEGKKLLKFLYEIYGTYRALKSSNLPSEVYKTLRRKEEEFLLLLAALFPDVEEKVVNFMRDWRFVEPLVSGKDIKELGLKPGPAFKEILNRIKCEIIDGRVSREDREEQYSRLKEMVVGKVSPSS